MNQIATPFATWAGCSNTISRVKDDRAEETRSTSLSLENTILQVTWFRCLPLITLYRSLRFGFIKRYKKKKKSPKMSLPVKHYPTQSIWWSFSAPNTEKEFHLPVNMSSFHLCLSRDIRYQRVSQLVTGTLRTEITSSEPLSGNHNN